MIKEDFSLSFEMTKTGNKLLRKKWLNQILLIT